MKQELQDLITDLDNIQLALVNVKIRLMKIVESDPNILILDKLTNLEETIMALSDKEQTLISRFDAATTKIAAELKDLKDKVAAAGGSTTEIDAAFDAKIKQLEDLGADSTNPIPSDSGVTNG